MNVEIFQRNRMGLYGVTDKTADLFQWKIRMVAQSWNVYGIGFSYNPC